MDHFHLIIVTGMSGAGKTHAVQVLEDIGYFCIDNIPPVLIPKFAELCIKGGERVRHVALIADIRGGEFFDAMSQCLKDLKDLKEKAFLMKSSLSKRLTRPWSAAIRKRAGVHPLGAVTAASARALPKTEPPGFLAKKADFYHRYIQFTAETAEGNPGQTLCHYGQQKEHDRHRRVFRL